ncbi:MAG: prepilin peptidase [Actinobacteria bacterium]|nr:prepilin peptidase [Actinomycetota bacterium]MCG2803449.1 prepilin peptidase [Cellulomonas sp.]
MLVAFAALVGLLIGSFLNVVVYRVPAGLSVVSPPSACPRCDRPIRPRDNIPVLSWVLLRGRCRDCREPISPRYPLVEAGNAALFAVATALTGPTWSLPVVLYLCGLGVALALIDLDVHRLPDALVLPSYPVVAVLLVLAAANPGGGSDWPMLLRALLGGLLLGGIYFVLAVAKPGGMGMGDVKLAGLLGAASAAIGWGAFAVGSFAAFLLGGIAGIVLMVVGRAGRRTAIPFGPWMLLGAAVGAVWGEPLWAAYLGAF